MTQRRKAWHIKRRIGTWMNIHPSRFYNHHNTTLAEAITMELNRCGHLVDLIILNDDEFIATWSNRYFNSIRHYKKMEVE